jgi:hypothetical protein
MGTGRKRRAALVQNGRPQAGDELPGTRDAGFDNQDAAVRGRERRKPAGIPVGYMDQGQAVRMGNIAKDFWCRH